MANKHPFEEAHSIGPKMVKYLKAIGVTDFDDLVETDANELALRINVELGGNHMNALGVRALENLVTLAKEKTAK